MIWITADTNVIVSAVISEHGKPAKLLGLARNGAIRLAVSDAILNETADVLFRKFDWPQDDISEVQRQLVRYGHKVTPGETLDVVAADADDNRILECAIAAHCDYVVTGDRHLLALGSFRDMPIVKVSDMLRLIAGRGRDR